MQKSRNIIHAPRNAQGEWVEDKKSQENMVQEYCTSLFSAETRNIPQGNPGINYSKLSEAHKCSLNRPIIMEEVKQALF